MNLPAGFCVFREVDVFRLSRNSRESHDKTNDTRVGHEYSFIRADAFDGSQGIFGSIGSNGAGIREGYPPSGMEFQIKT